MEVNGLSMQASQTYGKAEGGSSLPRNDAVQDRLDISLKAKLSQDKYEQDKALVEKLKKNQEDIERHENAHQAQAGELFRGKSFTYRIGPDGQRYIVGGEVQIDSSAVPGNPEATLEKMKHVARAALAPDDPSGQDISVAAAATRLEAEAREEISKESFEKNSTLKKKIAKRHKSTGSVRDGKLQEDAKDQTLGQSTNDSDVQTDPASSEIAKSMGISMLFGNAKLAKGKNLDVNL